MISPFSSVVELCPVDRIERLLQSTSTNNSNSNSNNNGNGNNVALFSPSPLSVNSASNNVMEVVVCYGEIHPFRMDKEDTFEELLNRYAALINLSISLPRYLKRILIYIYT